MVKISNRLMTAAALVTQGYTLADVGTDHGYIPIYLLQQKKIPSAIAMDINEGPLERAKEHIALYGLQAYIQRAESFDTPFWSGGRSRKNTGRSWKRVQCNT